MRLLLINHIENAIDSLRSTRTRSLLTMLGIGIGIASITFILSLSSGATKIVTDQVQQLDGNIAIIRPGVTTSTPRIDDVTAPNTLGFATSHLTEEDLKSLRSVPNIEAIAPIMTLGGTIKSGASTAPARTSIVATTPELLSTADIDVRDGQFIDSVANPDTVVIGSQLSIDLFGTSQSIGHNLTIRGHDFTVIGILKRTNKPINYNNIDFDRAAIIGLEAGKTLHQNALQLQQINIKASSADKLAGAVQGIEKTLHKNHRGEPDYTVLSGTQVAQPTSQLFYTFAATMAAIATVSLVVGGIGIMNIMLVAVAERTREIGIRKSVGASHRHITWQFLIESLALSLGGGIGGYIAGYLFAFIVSRSLLTFDPIFSWEIAGIAIGISVVIGTLFGLYPALRAARKHPIEALRQYH